MTRPHKIYICFCVEQGFLEDQARLLVKSIKRTFRRINYEIVAFSPRKNQTPGRDCRNFLKQSGVILNTDPINQEFTNYPIANKVFACSALEEQTKNENSSILFVDTDTVFIKEPTEINTDRPSLFLRPVDNKGPASEGPLDKNESFWIELFDFFSLPLPQPSVHTTVSNTLIRPYFNAGFIWPVRLKSFFQHWEHDFLKTISCSIRPSYKSQRDSMDYRFLDQVALAITASRHQEYLHLLPKTYNYPIPFHHKLKKNGRAPKLNELVHIHYHKWFNHPQFLRHIINSGSSFLETKGLLWLENELPLFPTISAPFKN